VGIFTTALEVAGIAALAVAGFLVAPALGCLAVGVCLIGLGWLLGRKA
jgi:membrane protein DedA with SNARE-associated domain